MTKEQLKKYRTWKAELADLELDINSKTVHDSVQKSKREFPHTFGHDHIEGVPNENYDLLIQKSDLKAKIKEIEDFVNGIEDDEIRAIISLRYIRGRRSPSWQNIAMKLGYRAEHTPKRKLKKYFSNVGNVGF